MRMTIYDKHWLIGGVLVLQGVHALAMQWGNGLAVTGMNDHVSWGLYIGQFIFLVGIAASAVILVVPTWWMEWQTIRPVVKIGEKLAVTAVITSLLFVWVDLGHPLRSWHMLPGLGSLNWPASVMAWDIIVLTLYLALNLLLLTLNHTVGAPRWWLRYAIVLAIFLGIAIHTVTAFLLAGQPSRLFWHTSILAPRFIVSAFASGAALMALILARVVDTTAPVEKNIVSYLRWVFLLTLIGDLLLLGSELFVVFYRPSDAGRALRLIYSGEADWLGGWFWCSLWLKVIGIALAIRQVWSFGMVAALIGLWMEKGVGLITGGLLLSPLGEKTIYLPTWLEVRITIGIWAASILLFMAYINRPQGTSKG